LQLLHVATAAVPLLLEFDAHAVRERGDLLIRRVIHLAHFEREEDGLLLARSGDHMENERVAR
jgi:hypothetical protein